MSNRSTYGALTNAFSTLYDLGTKCVPIVTKLAGLGGAAWTAQYLTRDSETGHAHGYDFGANASPSPTYAPSDGASSWSTEDRDCICAKYPRMCKYCGDCSAARRSGHPSSRPCLSTRADGTRVNGKRTGKASSPSFASFFSDGSPHSHPTSSAWAQRAHASDPKNFASGHGPRSNPPSASFHTGDGWTAQETTSNSSADQEARDSSSPYKSTFFGLADSAPGPHSSRPQTTRDFTNLQLRRAELTYRYLDRLHKWAHSKALSRLDRLNEEHTSSPDTPAFDAQRERTKAAIEEVCEILEGAEGIANFLYEVPHDTILSDRKGLPHPRFLQYYTDETDESERVPLWEIPPRCNPRSC